MLAHTVGLAVAILELPGVALACPVCFASKNEANRVAFVGTTILMTSLPVAMIGGAIYWVARRSRTLDAERRRQARAARRAAARLAAGAPARSKVPAVQRGV